MVEWLENEPMTEDVGAAHCVSGRGFHITLLERGAWLL